MMKIKLANGTEFEYERAEETSEFYDNANRRTLTLRMKPEGLTLDAVNAAFSDAAATASLALTNYNEDGSIFARNIYDHYSIKISVSCEPVAVGEDAETGAELKADRIIVKLGKLTYIEQQLAALGLAAAAQ